MLARQLRLCSNSGPRLAPCRARVASDEAVPYDQTKKNPKHSPCARCTSQLRKSQACRARCACEAGGVAGAGRGRTKEPPDRQGTGIQVRPSLDKGLRLAVKSVGSTCEKTTKHLSQPTTTQATMVKINGTKNHDRNNDVNRNRPFCARDGNHLCNMTMRMRIKTHDANWVVAALVEVRAYTFTTLRHTHTRNQQPEATLLADQNPQSTKKRTAKAKS